MKFFSSIACKTAANNHISIVRFCMLLALLLCVGAVAIQAQIQTSVPSLSGFIQTNTITCPSQSYLLTGTNISADVVVTAPAGFEISENQILWVAPPGSITIGQNGPTTIPPTTIFVRLNTPTLGIYTGNISHTSTDAASLFLAVSGIRSAKSPTTTGLLSSLNPSVIGQLVTLTANVTSPLTGTPSGTVTFYDGASSLATVALNLSASASLNTSALTFGSHNLTAKYNGDVTFDTSSSSTVSQFVQGTTTTVVVSNNNPSVSGQSVTFTATVSSTSPGTPTGSVTFYDGVSSLGSAVMSGGSAALLTSALTPGSHSITATYSSDVSFAGSTSSALSQMVKAITTTGLASNHNPSVSGQLVTLTATIGSVTPGTITGTVTFFDGAIPVGVPATISAGTATYTSDYTAFSSPHSFTATYNGDANYAGSTSSAVIQTINKASTTAIISANHNPSFVGQSVTFSATVSATAPGSGIPTGSVIFTVDGTPGSPISMSSGVASMSTSSLVLGLHTISGSYSGDVNFNAITSSTYADTVDPIITTTVGPHGSIFPSGSVLAPYGGNQIFTITPAIGYQVDSLFIDGVGKLGAESDTFFNVTTNHTIHATFIVKTFTVTVSAGSNGTALPLGAVPVLRADSLVVNFTGDPHYHVADILLDGLSVGAAPSYTLRNVLSEHTIHVTFTIDTFTITATAGANGGISPSGSVVLIYNANQSFTFTPDLGYAVDSIFVDGSYAGNGVSYPFTNVAADRTIFVTFALTPQYATTYRTAKPGDWANALDHSLKRKSVKRKADKVKFKFNIIAPNTATGFMLKFSMHTDGKISTRKAKADTLRQWTEKDTVIYSVNINSGDTLQVDGIGAKGAKLKTSVIWRTSPHFTTVRLIDANYKENSLRLPLPNLHNVGEELFPKGFGQNPIIFPNGMVVGVPQGSHGAKSVLHKKYADVLKTLVKVTGNGVLLHDGEPRCLDIFNGIAGNGHPIDRQQIGLPPDKHNNQLLAELTALKLNVAASAYNKFPNGLGGLTFFDASDPGNLLNGQTIDTIIVKADRVISCLLDLTKGDTLTPGEVYDVIERIDSAFSSGVIDTNSFATKTSLTGVRRLIDVPFLHPTPGIVPENHISPPVVIENMPMKYALHQNYPNPFNPSTTIQFELPNLAIVTLKVYNVLGQEVATLLNRETMEDGSQAVEFNASNLSSGVYFYRIIAEPIANEDGTLSGQPFTSVKKMLMIK